MAMYTALRRATATAVPLLSLRASATSSRTFHNAIAVNLCHKETTPLLEFPGYFPFEIVDNPGEKIFQLKRQFEDETITVQVDITHVSENEDDSESCIIPLLVVSIFKGNGGCLEFGMIAFRDEVTITRWSLKKPDESEDQMVYNGRGISKLDENLQKAFLEYLKIRGITPKITKFLQQYMFNKDKKEYLVWLKNLKSFIEK